MTTPNEELIVELRAAAGVQGYPNDLLSEAANALRSQAERIAELEGRLKAANEIDTSLCKEIDTLRAQIDQIAATEPVAYQFQTIDGGWHPFLDDRHYQNTKDDGRWPIRELFTRPMPQDVGELVKDAARYRWLRDQNADLDAGFYVGDETDALPGDIVWVGSDLDIAVDRAMAEGAK